MKKLLNCFVVCALFGILVSCNNYNNTNPYNPYNGSPPSLSSITFRAYVSNPIAPSASGIGGAPVLNIVDASTDILSPYTVALASLSASITDPGIMALSPKQDRTLVSSPADRKIAIVSNSGNSVTSTVTLPGPTESFFVWSDNKTAFAAVPNASVPGQSPGAVIRMDLQSATITATIPIPGAHYIVAGPNGSAILVFSDNSDTVTVLSPSLIGANTQSNAQVPCSSTQMAACTISASFDRPTWAVFSASGTTAYILNCGQQCGGVGAAPCLTFTSCTTVSALDMTQTPPAVVNQVGVPAATTGLLQGTTLYVAGTPVMAADNNCAGVTTSATSCGRLTVVDVSSMTAGTPVVITDGYHNRIQMGSNAQLFVGSHSCTNINSSGEVRGCLTIVNTSSGSISSSSVIAPPDNGDVTGIEPIPNRTVVYVCEGGNLRVYETTTDKLEVFHLPATGPNITGQAIDVKVVDF